MNDQPRPANQPNPLPEPEVEVQPHPTEQLEQPAAVAPAAETGQSVPPKKSRTGLILGIVLGGVGLLLLIGAVLFYLLWWKEPNRVVARSMASAIQAQKAEVSGILKASSEELTVSVDMTGHSSGSQAVTDMKITVESEGLGDPFDFTISTVNADDGTLFVRAGGLDELVDTIISSAIDARADMSPDEQIANEQREVMQRLFHDIFDPLVESVNDKWLRISPDAMKDYDESAACYSRAVQGISISDQAQRQLSDAYRKHSFLKVKERVGSRDSSTGYLIDLGSDEMTTEFRAFVGELKETDLGKTLAECGDTDQALDELSDEALGGGDASASKLVIWVDNFTDKLTGIDIESTQDDQTFTASIKTEIGKAGDVEIPADAEDIEDALSGMEGFLGGMLGGASSSL